jgi:hypothetical protein
MGIGRIRQVLPLLIPVNTRYVNQSDEDQFDGISLIMVLLKQDSLVTPSLRQNEGTCRFNGYVVANQCSFIKTLVSKLLDTSHELLDSLELYRNLQILELLGLHSSEIDKMVNDLLLTALKNDKEYNSSVIGVLLSLHSDSNSMRNFGELVELLSSQMTTYASDIRFLEGLERVLSNLSM